MIGLLFCGVSAHCAEHVLNTAYCDVWFYTAQVFQLFF